MTASQAALLYVQGSQEKVIVFASRSPACLAGNCDVCAWLGFGPVNFDEGPGACVLGVLNAPGNGTAVLGPISCGLSSEIALEFASRLMEGCEGEAGAEGPITFTEGSFFLKIFDILESLLGIACRDC